MVWVGTTIHRSQSLARLHFGSPSQITARKLVRKYSLGSRIIGQRRELTSLRSTLPHMKAASDLDLVLEAIKYIEQLQQKVVCMSRSEDEEPCGMCQTHPGTD